MDECLQAKRPNDMYFKMYVICAPSDYKEQAYFKIMSYLSTNKPVKRHV